MCNSLKKPRYMTHWLGYTVQLKQDARNMYAKIPAGTQGIVTGKTGNSGIHVECPACTCCGITLQFAAHPDQLDIIAYNEGKKP